MWWYILIVVGILACAVMAIRAKRLLMSALWLAGCSAFTALLMYLLGAHEVAVIELSVGAGLVTVLFVFAINLTGDENITVLPTIPRWLSGVLILVSVIILGWFTLAGFNLPLSVSAKIPLQLVLWQDRNLDVLLQVVLIFSGVLGVLGLLSEETSGHSSSEEHSS